MGQIANSSPQLSISILGADWLAFGEAVEMAEAAGANLIQIDVADGVFTPTITFGEELVRRVRKKTRLPIEVHLMVSQPKDWVTLMSDCGADVIIFHFEAVPRVQGIIEKIKRCNLGVGVALNSETPAEVLEYVLPYLEVVTLMAIVPGYAGQHFIPEVFEKIGRLRRLIDSVPNCHAAIEVDGGITTQNVGRAIGTGTDIVVASSSIYGAPDPLTAAKELHREMSDSWRRAGRDGHGSGLVDNIARRRSKNKPL